QVYVLPIIVFSRVRDMSSPTTGFKSYWIFIDDFDCPSYGQIQNFLFDDKNDFDFEVLSTLLYMLTPKCPVYCIEVTNPCVEEIRKINDAFRRSNKHF